MWLSLPHLAGMQFLLIFFVARAHTLQFFIGLIVLRSLWKCITSSVDNKVNKVKNNDTQ